MDRSKELIDRKRPRATAAEVLVEFAARAAEPPLLINRQQLADVRDVERHIPIRCRQIASRRSTRARNRSGLENLYGKDFESRAK